MLNCTRRWMIGMGIAVVLVLGTAHTNTLWAAPAKVKKPQHPLLDKKFRTLFRQARTQIVADQHDAAIVTARKMMALWPTSARALMIIATAYKGKKLYVQAVDFFRRSANAFSRKTEFFERAQALYNVAYCFELQKQRQSAIAAWQTYLNFASAYNQEAASVSFARKRIKMLRSVKPAAR